MKRSQQEWFDEQTEKSLLYLIYNEVKSISNIATFWLVLTVLGLVVGCLFAVLSMSGLNLFNLNF